MSNSPELADLVQSAAYYSDSETKARDLFRGHRTLIRINWIAFKLHLLLGRCLAFSLGKGAWRDFRDSPHPTFSPCPVPLCTEGTQPVSEDLDFLGAPSLPISGPGGPGQQHRCKRPQPRQPAGDRGAVPPTSIFIASERLEADHDVLSLCFFLKNLSPPSLCTPHPQCADNESRQPDRFPAGEPGFQCITET